MKLKELITVFSKGSGDSEVVFRSIRNSEHFNCGFSYDKDSKKFVIYMAGPNQIDKEFATEAEINLQVNYDGVSLDQGKQAEAITNGHAVGVSPPVGVVVPKETIL